MGDPAAGNPPDTLQNIEIPALGRPFRLGTLYDCRTDTMVSAFSLWDLDKLNANLAPVSTPKIECHVIKQDDVTHRAKALSMTASHKVDYLAEKSRRQIAGAASFLGHDQTSATCNRAILHYSCTTESKELSMSHLSSTQTQHDEQIIKNVHATHVVVRIVYGAEAFFVFENDIGDVVRTDSASPNLRQLEEAVTKLEQVQRHTAVKHDQYEIPQAPKGSKIRCRYFGDFRIDTSPQTYDESAKFIAEIPTRLADPTNIVPKMVVLQPLSAISKIAVPTLIKEIDELLMGRVGKVLEFLHGAESRCADLLQIPAVRYFPATETSLTAVQRAIEDYQITFRKNIVKHTTEIRTGASQSEALQKLLEEHEASRFCEGLLKPWLDQKTTEARYLMRFLRKPLNVERLENAPIKLIKSQAEFNELLTNSDFKNYVCFEFHLSGEPDEYVKGLTSGAAANARDGVPQSAEKPKPWFEQSREVHRMWANLQSFFDLAEANHDGKAYGFTLGCSDISAPTSGFQITNLAGKVSPNELVKLTKPFKIFLCEVLSSPSTDAVQLKATEANPPITPTVLSVRKADEKAKDSQEPVDIEVSCGSNFTPDENPFKKLMNFTVYYRPVSDGEDVPWTSVPTVIKGVMFFIRAKICGLDPERMYEFKVEGSGKLKTRISAVFKPPALKDIKTADSLLRKLVVPWTWKRIARLARLNRTELEDIPLIGPAIWPDHLPPPFDVRQLPKYVASSKKPEKKPRVTKVVDTTEDTETAALRKPFFPTAAKYAAAHRSEAEMHHPSAKVDAEGPSTAEANLTVTEKTAQGKVDKKTAEGKASKSKFSSLMSTLSSKKRSDKPDARSVFLPETKVASEGAAEDVPEATANGVATATAKDVTEATTEGELNGTAAVPDEGTAVLSSEAAAVASPGETLTTKPDGTQVLSSEQQPADLALDGTDLAKTDESSHEPIVESSAPADPGLMEINEVDQGDQVQPGPEEPAQTEVHEHGSVEASAVHGLGQAENVTVPVSQDVTPQLHSEGSEPAASLENESGLSDNSTDQTEKREGTTTAPLTPDIPDVVKGTEKKKSFLSAPKLGFSMKKSQASKKDSKPTSGDAVIREEVKVDGEEPSVASRKADSVSALPVEKLAKKAEKTETEAKEKKKKGAKDPPAASDAAAVVAGTVQMDPVDAPTAQKVALSGKTSSKSANQLVAWGKPLVKAAKATVVSDSVEPADEDFPLLLAVGYSSAEGSKLWLKYDRKTDAWNSVNGDLHDKFARDRNRSNLIVASIDDSLVVLSRDLASGLVGLDKLDLSTGLCKSFDGPSCNDKRSFNNVACIAGDTVLLPVSFASTRDTEGGYHPGVMCSSCKEQVRGHRFKCKICPDFNYCHKCHKDKNKHTKGHEFKDIAEPPASHWLADRIQETESSKSMFSGLKDTVAGKETNRRCEDCAGTIKEQHYKCLVCPHFDLCKKCVLGMEEAKRHDEHSFALLEFTPARTDIQYLDMNSGEWGLLEKGTLAPHASLVVLEDELYAVGGAWPKEKEKDPRDYSATLQKYDQEKARWDTLPHLHTARAFAGTAVLGGNMYVVGGMNQAGNLSSGERFNPENQTWTKLPELKKIKGPVSLAVVNNELYALAMDKVAMSERDGEGWLLEKYNILKDSWKELKPIQGPETKACGGFTRISLVALGTHSTN